MNTQRLTTPLWILISLLVAGVGAYVYVFYFQGNWGAPTRASLSGTLMLTATNPAGSPLPVTAYDYSFADDAATPLVVDMPAYAGQELTFQYALSPNQKWMTFIAARESTKEAPLSATESAAQVFRAAVTAGTSPDELAADAQAAKQKTNTASLKRWPSVSDDGAILYMAHEGDAALLSTSTPADSWSVVFIPADGTPEQTLAQGKYPHWLDASHFVFIKDDGLYVYNLGDRFAQKVWDYSASAAPQMSLDTSSDGTLVVLNSPSEHSFMALHSNDWSKGASTTASAEFSGDTPVVSPDGNMFAAVSAAYDENDKLISVIRIFDSATLAPIAGKSLISIPQFELGNVGLTDWIQ